MNQVVLPLTNAAGALQAPAGGIEIERGVLPSKSDPSAIALEVAEGIRSGARSLIGACTLLVDALHRFSSDADLKSAFLAALIRENVIPRRSTRLGDVDNSKLSMLRKIGEQAHLLLSVELSKYLEPGYSVLYHIIRLYEALAGDHEVRIKRLVELFEAEGHLSRDFLITQINVAKQSEKEAESANPWLNAGNGVAFDLVVATVLDRRHLRRLADDYADRPPLCLKTHERVTKDAVAIIIARLAHLPVIENRLLPSCGFNTISNVLLSRAPFDPDVTDAEAIIFAERGSLERVRVADFQWLPDVEDLDPVVVASRLVPNAKHKLHLFAPKESAGWCSVLGEANWS
jgi:hypothetical protein